MNAAPGCWPTCCSTPSRRWPRRSRPRLLPEAADLSLAELRRRALAALAELDAFAMGQRHEEAKRAADVRAYETGDGMATLAGDMTVEDAAACHAVIDALAQMAKADGDPRPIGEIRSAIMAMLILRPADHGQPGVTVQLAVTAPSRAWRAPAPAAARSTASPSPPRSCATCSAASARWV